MKTLAARASIVTEHSSITHLDDSELVERARRRDPWAEEALYRRHVRPVTNAVARLLGSSGDADDVVQETFLKGLTELAQLRDSSAFRPWILRIAVSLCHRRFRRNRLLEAIGLYRGDHEETLEAHALAGSRPDLAVELREIDRLLRSQPIATRSAWILHRVEGWTLEETADALAVSLATVKRRVREADLLIASMLAEGGA